MAHRALELNMKKLWTLWAKALGEKAGDDSQADKVALIRTAIVMCYIITNIFIVAGVIRHW
jgi:hypothetical protein